MSTYEGWSNFESWSVSLVLNNEQALQERALRVVEGGIRLGPPSPYWTEPQRRRYRAAEALEAWVRDEAASAVPAEGSQLAPLWSQLLTSALDEVDWQEVTDGFLKMKEERDG
jgi:hypothetical protein